MKINSTPLGYVQLVGGAMPIHAMNDLLLNYTFENAAHWEGLKQTVNIVINAYRKYARDNHKLETKLQPITGNITVRTQYQFLLKNDKKTTKNQDIEITAESQAIIYVEFQNRAESDINVRAAEYFGLSIGHSKGRPVEQIWLLAEDVDTLLGGKAFSRHILKDEATGEVHPGNNGILYVSLIKLANEDTPAGELAQFLLGKLQEPKDETVKEIADMFNSSFEIFKEDKEVVGMLTLEERGMKEGLYIGRQEGLQEGRQEGRQEGFTEGIKRIRELIKEGYSFDEAEQKVAEETGVAFA